MSASLIGLTFQSVVATFIHLVTYVLISLFFGGTNVWRIGPARLPLFMLGLGLPGNADETERSGGRATAVNKQQ